MKISIFGTGYVGLVSGACLADVGHHVVCMDIDPVKIEKLKSGILPVWEQGLEKLIERNVMAERLQFATDTAHTVQHGQVQFIAVGTPSDEDGSADLQYVLEVAENIAFNMHEYKVIVNKSTVPIGTADKVLARVAQVLAGRGVKLSFDVVSNPEFLKEGDTVNDFFKRDRIVVGIKGERARALMCELYEPFNRNHERMGTIFIDVRSAELTKYAANAMLATKISFMNEMANLAELLGGRYRGGTDRHRRRPAHWLSLHLPWVRLWRQLLPKGRQGASPYGTAGWLQRPVSPGSAGGQRHPEDYTFLQVSSAFWR